MDTSRIEGYDLENLKISTSIDQLFLAGHGLTRLSLKEIQNLLPSEFNDVFVSISLYFT